jgi:hypothetical protein
MGIARRLRADLRFRLWALKGALFCLSLALWPRTVSGMTLAWLTYLNEGPEAVKTELYGRNWDD